MENCKNNDHQCVKSQTLPMCDVENLTPDTVHGPMVVKLPVVLADAEIQIDVEACINIGEPFYEVKRVKKNVFLTQCRLLASAGKMDPSTGHLLTGKLFLKGYVEKNIEYATKENDHHSDCIVGKIKHTTARIPFHCLTEVKILRQPVIKKRGSLIETDLFCDDSNRNKCYDCGDELLGKSFCETEFEEKVYYVERPYCELESARIYEVDIYNNCSESNHHDKSYGHDDNTILEKMVVCLRVKVLQQQQVKIGYKDC